MCPSPSSAINFLRGQLSISLGQGTPPLGSLI
uniref:Uncharacterized protein n=1 Tax=Anguilla anguilla TaxID=7936 RepID=A0A0E9SEX6_ANGAN